MNRSAQCTVQEISKTNEWWRETKDTWVDINRERWIREGQRLKERRQNVGISRAKMARLMEVSTSRLRRLEIGEGIRDARVIRKFYEVTVDNIEREIDFSNELSSLE